MLGKEAVFARVSSAILYVSRDAFTNVPASIGGGNTVLDSGSIVLHHRRACNITRLRVAHSYVFVRL